MHSKYYTITKPLTKQLPYGTDKWFEDVQIRLFHSTGGINYINGAIQDAGWYLSFAPVHIEKHDTYETTSTELFHKRAFKMRCCDGARFSAKKLEKLSKILNENVDKIVKLYDDQLDLNLYSFITTLFGDVK